MSSEQKRVALLILDGLGYGKDDNSNAVIAAKTPYLDYLLANYPNSKLEASGEAVGLPAGQMGNSEVGHMNLGAGRTVYQELGRINKAAKDGIFKSDLTIEGAFDYAKENNKKVHFIGLLSDGGVHSHISHLKALCDAAKHAELTSDQVFIHAFLDGRDTDPNGGIGYMRDLTQHLTLSVGTVASAIGRYYAMDRDNRWERVKEAYDLLTKGVGTASTDILASIEASYANDVTDEFVKPIVMVKPDGSPIAKIENGDVVICYNFRTDRGREITIALTQQAFPEYDMHPLDLYYVTMTSYDDTFKGVKVIFQKDNLTKTLGETLAAQNKTQVRIAETEKYPHVTFFFSGGREEQFEGESRILIPSPKVATYDLQPEMSAQGIADAICLDMVNNHPDFICLNFANPDMVGHTGVFDAVVKAVEKVDAVTKQVVDQGLAEGYSFIILADHGNSEYMLNSDGSVNTAHTTNLVPCILIDKDYQHIKDGKLGDVAPTVLKMMNLEIPLEMNGDVLVY
ncbi:2,3-bisphosphoglycerate-independent phosphoglycerate mutase [Sphingobacterium sp. DK4209]|uniref:2,3-bisphosphoglycerate-independent phosphoglycerate mutase n=1 Tax=Sphingobacterium zhuxiongii TaxID=2662364 RepID=A0A5Q0QEM2_9SPHI|nr:MULTISPECIES: 2,3-bisphosphoglycerate-independent phosphoglycerate mutase [unclassified Sphingobacterium]MVZ67126.1 2,3-bisphosphoglycerate-independent phosphoglycerate mutase [Sphingobacterium sp. DK4209]QGA25992.1 2,3-bisphosphoglycerate-independent phosphoglycerate mutase [Sphingobacterium sp. dk4302]